MPKGLDLTTASAVQGIAEWLLKKSGALLVVVVRVDDMAITAHPQLAPRDSTHLLEDRMPELHAQLERERVAARAKAQRLAVRDEKKVTR